MLLWEWEKIQEMLLRQKLMKLKIGAVKFEVIEKAGLKSGKVLLNGHIIYNDQNILIDEKLKPDGKKITILHEILHGIIGHAGGTHKERQIEMMANGLHQVFMENKKEMKEILWGEK